MGTTKAPENMFGASLPSHAVPFMHQSEDCCALGRPKVQSSHGLLKIEKHHLKIRHTWSAGISGITRLYLKSDDGLRVEVGFPSENA